MYLDMPAFALCQLLKILQVLGVARTRDDLQRGHRPGEGPETMDCDEDAGRGDEPVLPAGLSRARYLRLRDAMLLQAFEYVDGVTAHLGT